MRAGVVVGTPVDVGESPDGMTFGAGRLWVSVLDNNTVVAIDPSTARVIGRPIKGRPRLGQQLRQRHAETALSELEQAGVSDKPGVVVADALYWNEQHMDDLIAGHGIPVLIPPDSGKREGERPGWTGGDSRFMRRVLASDLGKQLYGKRQQSIEPVFGHTKHNRKIYRFNYRGRQAVRTEWRLILMSHNLTKLHRHQAALAT